MRSRVRAIALAPAALAASPLLALALCSAFAAAGEEAPQESGEAFVLPGDLPEEGAEPLARRYLEGLSWTK